MILIRARACIKCHEFITLHPNNPASIQIEKEFEKKHASHTMVITDVDEIKGTYHKYHHDES